MNVKNIFFLSIATVVVMSCAKPNSKKTLPELEKEKIALASELESVEQQIKQLKGELPGEDIRFVPVNISTVEIHEFKNFFTVQGYVQSDRDIQVPSEASGIVKSVKFEQGDYVKKGSILAEIDNTLYMRQKDELLTSLELARTNFERQSRLWEQKIGSEMQYLQAKNQKESLEKRLATLNEQITNTVVIAPISGHLDEVKIKEGEIAQMGMPVFRIVQLSNLKVEAEVSEQYVSDVHKSDSVMIEFPGAKKSFMAVIDAISEVINPDTRTFRIEIKIPKEISYLKPNMLSEVKIFNYVNPEAVCVPMGIVQKSETGEFVFVVEQNNEHAIAKRRNIVINNFNTHYAEISSGINVGDVIVVDGYQNLSNNQEVQIIK